MKVMNRPKDKTVSAVKDPTSVIRHLIDGSGSTVRGAQSKSEKQAREALKDAARQVKRKRRQARRQLMRARIATAKARAQGGDRASSASVKAVGAAGAAGLAAGYFLDQDSGRRRRHVAKDRVLALIRRGVDAPAARRSTGRTRSRARSRPRRARRRRGSLHRTTRRSPSE